MWPKQKDMLRIYGNPSAYGWASTHITYVTPPFLMFSGKIPIIHIPINKDVAEDFKSILNEIWIASGKSQKKIREFGMDRFDGSFVVRSIRGGKGWSNHAFGMAVDFDARRNPLGSTKTNFTNSHPVVKIFKRHGCRWGGNYKRRKDAMHFEWVSG